MYFKTILLLSSLFILSLSAQDPTPDGILRHNSGEFDGPRRNRFESSESSLFMYPGFRFRWPSADPFREIMRHNPFSDIERLMESRVGPMLSSNGMDSGLGDVFIKEDSFKYTVSMDGFEPNEIKLKVDNDRLIISGEHKVLNENGTVIGQKTFLRSYLLPIGYKKDTIKSVFDGNKLEITGQREPQQPKREPTEIPIEFTETPRKQDGNSGENKNVDVNNNDDGKLIDGHIEEEKKGANDEV